MPPQTATADPISLATARGWLRLTWLTLPFLLALVGLHVLEDVAIAWIDRWLPIDSMEAATRYSLLVATAGSWLRMCVIGAGIYRALNAAAPSPGGRLSPAFLPFWCSITLAFVLSLLPIDLWRNALQFSDAPRDAEATRALWLASTYAKIALFYIAARLLFGAPELGRGRLRSWTAAWSATTTMKSIVLFLILLASVLFVENVLVTLFSYFPLVSPFWFVPNELSPQRYLVSQGARIAAESAGIILYAAFWVALDDRLDGERSEIPPGPSSNEHGPGSSEAH